MAEATFKGYEAEKNRIKKLKQGDSIEFIFKSPYDAGELFGIISDFNTDFLVSKLPSEDLEYIRRSMSREAFNNYGPLKIIVDTNRGIRGIYNEEMSDKLGNSYALFLPQGRRFGIFGVSPSLIDKAIVTFSDMEELPKHNFIIERIQLEPPRDLVTIVNNRHELIEHAFVWLKKPSISDDTTIISHRGHETIKIGYREYNLKGIENTFYDISSGKPINISEVIILVNDRFDFELIKDYIRAYQNNGFNLMRLELTTSAKYRPKFRTESEKSAFWVSYLDKNSPTSRYDFKAGIYYDALKQEFFFESKMLRENFANPDVSSMRDSFHIASVETIGSSRRSDFSELPIIDSPFISVVPTIQQYPPDTSLILKDYYLSVFNQKCFSKEKHFWT